ncbi:hypothetical protein BO70DRAFT_379418 [Aspergillus heteromorphus CBS 117.55]|uniref:HIT domain-containing protein n=1 Tax=Aspergillus heteromorphus CBS 117.55 TaxID=1448321 RepID=A0A317W942_9EURO|nr:uncharacterized protein BO70DRAFT_379418 [Aspergillus heteromorphus CBS 117.55]PWY82853.1 hypothetical protein BO70DRAFT_379418 [Aspergillus heteromorphus CBS 117.55]
MIVLALSPGYTASSGFSLYPAAQHITITPKPLQHHPTPPLKQHNNNVHQHPHPISNRNIPLPRPQPKHNPLHPPHNLRPRPRNPHQHQHQDPLFTLPKPTFITTLLTIRHISQHLQRIYSVQRIALITTGLTTLSILPLHGLSPTWHPITNPSTVFHGATYPGYLTSKDAPLMSTSQLDQIAQTITTATTTSLPTQQPDYTSHTPTSTNLFSRIIRGETQHWRIWEDADHVAFLTPFPNTVGFTVLVPRAHLSSDILGGLDEGAFTMLMGAAYEVVGVLRRAFGVERCGMVFEGFEIDYAHVKIIPVHGGAGDVDVDEGEGGDGDGERERFWEVYPGYLSSLPGPVVEDYDGLVRRAGEVRREVMKEMGE